MEWVCVRSYHDLVSAMPNRKQWYLVVASKKKPVSTLVVTALGHDRWMTHCAEVLVQKALWSRRAEQDVLWVAEGFPPHTLLPARKMTEPVPR
jgi:hypothetical protein